MNANNHEVDLVIEQSFAAKQNYEFDAQEDVGQPAPCLQFGLGGLVLVTFSVQICPDPLVNMIVLKLHYNRYAHYLQRQKHEFGRLKDPRITLPH